MSDGGSSARSCRRKPRLLLTRLRGNGHRYGYFLSPQKARSRHSRPTLRITIYSEALQQPYGVAAGCCRRRRLRGRQRDSTPKSYHQLASCSLTPTPPHHHPPHASLWALAMLIQTRQPFSSLRSSCRGCLSCGVAALGPSLASFVPCSFPQHARPRPRTVPRLAIEHLRDALQLSASLNDLDRARRERCSR